jgi:hypothetical protein
MDTLPPTIEECHEIIRLLLSSLDKLSKRIDGMSLNQKRYYVMNYYGKLNPFKNGQENC